MTMPKALNIKNDIDRPYTIRKEGERGLANTGDCVDREIQGFEEDEKSKEILITAINNSNDNRGAKIKRSRKQK